MTLSVADLVDEAVRYGWRERSMMVRHGAIPAVVIALVTLLAPGYMAEGATGAQKAMGAALMVAQLLVCVPMVVTWYRMVVLGKEEGLRQPIFVFGRREWRLLGWQIAVMFAGVAVLGLCGAALAAIYVAMDKSITALALCVGLGLATLLVAFVVITRLSFVFTLAATDQPASFKQAWRMSRDVTWPLLWSLVIISLGQAIVTFIADLVGGVFAAAVHGAATVFAFTAMATLFGQVFLSIRDARSTETVALGET
jgi:hypothetical protein